MLKTRLLQVSVWIFGAAVVFFATMALELGKKESSSVSQKNPTSLLGDWHQIKSDREGILMQASVKPGSIQINLVTREGSNVYWLGTFDTDKGLTGSFETVSEGDQDAMAMSIFGSGSKTKSFTYKDGQLSYEFTMLGTTSTVHLAKQGA